MRRRNLAILIGGLSALAIVTGFLTWAYGYGKPIGQTIVATTITGEQIINPPEIQVHLAYTPLYAFSLEWRLFADSAARVLGAYTLILEVIGFAAGSGFSVFRYLKWRLSRMKPGDQFWPYKFWPFG